MLNVCFIAGNLGADPELKAMSDGSHVCSLRVATTEKWADNNGEKKERTEWHNVDVWGKQAESCAKYLSKGRKVLIEGAIKYRNVEKDGIKRTYTTIKANRVHFLGERQQNNPSQAAHDGAFDISY